MKLCIHNYFNFKVLLSHPCCWWLAQLTTSVRRVSSALCEAVASNTVDADIREEMTKTADRCLAAKERLLGAETDAQINAAIRRVEILCDD